MLLHDRLSLHNWIPAHFYYFTSIHPPLFPSIYMYTHRYCASETMNYVRFLNKKNISVSSDYLEYKWAQYKAVKQMLFPITLHCLCHYAIFFALFPLANSYYLSLSECSLPGKLCFTLQGQLL